MDLNSYLAGLKKELDGAIRLGKTTVGEIEAEIARVEKELETLPERVARAGRRVESSLATRAEKLGSYLKGLVHELEGAKPKGDANRVKAIQAEIETTKAQLAALEPADDEADPADAAAEPAEPATPVSADPTSPKATAARRANSKP